MVHPLRMVKLEEILPECSQTSFRLILSIDGIESDHDENRSMKGSFQRIINPIMQRNI